MKTRRIRVNETEHISKEDLLLHTVCKSTLSTVISVLMLSHEDTGTAVLGGTLLSQTSNLTIIVHSVEFQHSKLDILVLVLDFLGSRVDFLLSLLTTSTKSQYQMKSSFFRDVVIAERSSVLEL